MKAEDNKFLCEQMGLCWHDFHLDHCGHYICRQCNHLMRNTEKAYPDFFTEKDWTKALLFAQDDSRHEGWTWDEFVVWSVDEFVETTKGKAMPREEFKTMWTRWLFTPATFAPVLVEFLRGREK